ncbi:(d)CMP kinase [Leucobacter coleopterorum]|uniref:Cytidylate kinase n=1 Tax=Leucobacter coleopterorum TaxID=2714933 RepID=A0ABX6JZ62_9MICO|nr:(d)CMP kinase [Leucobacter coleopterorum]QIM18075.1 (d)CMP kinase [Leucobacter coleopterorum]
MEDAVSDAVNTGGSGAAAPILVAIDGPAGSGKSSVSRAAAERLGFGLLDTGAAYRALAWAALENELDLDDEVLVAELVESWGYVTTLVGEPAIEVVLPAAIGVKGHDVTDAIRDPAISGQVSRVSKHPVVRARLNEMFRRIVAESELPGVIIEGRDITTVVAPDAPVRILMTASPEVRAARRAGELQGADHEQVLADIMARDAKDVLVVDFMNPAPGVTLIDTSDLDFGQSVQAVIDVVQAAQSTAAEESGK